jgi:hypothetical protein
MLKVLILGVNSNEITLFFLIFAPICRGDDRNITGDYLLNW